MTAHHNFKQELIDSLTKQIEKNFPKEQGNLVSAFAKQFYQNVAEEDLQSRVLVDLYGALASHWQFVYERRPKEAKVRVYNPQFEQHGWQSTRTIVEVVYEDLPFLLDSVRMAINREELDIHLVIHNEGLRFKRSKEGNVTAFEVGPVGKKNLESQDTEAMIYFEIGKQTNPDVLKSLQEKIIQVIQDVSIVVTDWPAMMTRLDEIIDEFKGSAKDTQAIQLFKNVAVSDQKELAETIHFLEWMRDNNFTFLGCCFYRLVENTKDDDAVWEPVPGSELGVLREYVEGEGKRALKDFSERGRKEILSSHPLVITRTDTISTVHRPVYGHSVSRKYYDAKGNVIGGCRFIGLLTSAAYHSHPTTIPIVRQRVNEVITRSGFPHDSHDGKALMNILETLPRHDLFEASADELLEISMGILHLQERQKIRLLMRKDHFGRYYSCLVFVPRERFHSVLRQKMQDLLTKELNGIESTFATRFSESILARIHFMVRVDPKDERMIHVSSIEKRLIEIAHTWEDDFLTAMLDHYGEERGTMLYHTYAAAFPASYREGFLPRTAVYDIEHFEALNQDKELAMSFYRPLEDFKQSLRFKLFRRGQLIPLSEVVPMIENMGVRVISERPHKILLKGRDPIWINDFELHQTSGLEFNVDDIKIVFQDAFDQIWHGFCENDGFNKLVLAAGLFARQISALRAYAKYIWQTGFTFSQNYVEQTLVTHPLIAKKLIELFECRFNPEWVCDGPRQDMTEAIKKEIEVALDGVQNLDEDRILRRYLVMVMATVRTNFYQQDESLAYKNYISFKFNPLLVPELPLPVPKHEIFVYSPWVEGVHLRGADVARGGIRWSDRKEDFRTEVLGLMKAQQVKNAVIVPLGAKGGFYCKNLTPDLTRDEWMARGIECYKTLIRGLLDITDNIIGDNVVPPSMVLRYDEDDPYLVVAADKGTATFSDIANELSVQYQFWLGDAFASGGSAGYDHKKMGITARGAWESVKRHFREIGIHPDKTPFKVVGIGDLSGDVFGNGMLMSNQIQLIAAFNHKHIFVDPSPDPALSFEERKRLFNLPRSQWTDYSADLISKGGGIFERAAKSIPISPEMKEALHLEKDVMQPNELIRAILVAPVDLLFNGGIGTYVKSSLERDADVGDKTNDPVRVNGGALQATVVCEGGNLGFTQLGRVEYALNGGYLNTDAIDNSGGVDCSDHEVNIKILLNAIMMNGDMTEKQRNVLLAEMTDEVAQLVLSNNREQTGAITLAAVQPATKVDMQIRLLNALEQDGSLNRQLEFLPNDVELIERKAVGKGLTRPEISVLMGYVKTWLKQQLLASNITEDPYLSRAIQGEFPKRLTDLYAKEMQNHRLRREIIATQLSNTAINETGINFVHRLRDEAGALPHDIVACYITAKTIFDINGIYNAISSLSYQIDSEIQLSMLQELNRLARRCTRWFLRNTKTGFDIAHSIQQFQTPVQTVIKNLPNLIVGSTKDMMDSITQSLMDAEVPEELALCIGGMPAMYSVLDIVSAAITEKFNVEQVAQVYFDVGARLEIDWFREQIKAKAVNTHWDAMARAAFRDDLDRQQRGLTLNILNMSPDPKDVDHAIDSWLTQHDRQVKRWYHIIAELKATPQSDFVMFAVALRELLDLTHAEHVIWH